MEKNINVNTSSSTEEKNNNSRKVIKLRGVNLNKDQLVFKDAKLADICVKSFDEMTEEEINLLPVCKAKVYKQERVDRYGSKVKWYEGQFLLCDGIIFTKRLTDSELNCVQNFSPELITDGKSQCYVPVKLITSIKKDGTRAFRYLACLAPGVYMGSKTSRDRGYIDEKNVNNIIAFNLTNKSYPERQIKFVDVSDELYDNSIDKILDNDSDNF